MATLDVSQIPLSAEFQDSFTVLARQEQIGDSGRVTVTAQTSTQRGTLYPSADNSLIRQEDQQHGVKTLTIVTPYRLQMASDGRQPDYIAYRGVMYMIRSVQDFTQYGAGFVVAEGSSLRGIDAPPQ